MVNQAKLHNNRNRPKYKFGIQVPRNHEEAMMIDAKNRDTRWKDAEELELKQLFDYNSFQDLARKGRGHSRRLHQDKMPLCVQL